MTLDGLPGLPARIRTYLDAHRGHDVPAAAGCFGPAPVVVDDGRTHRGRDAVRAWLERTSAEYTYTATALTAVSHDDRRWTVAQRLEGDFPGGTVDLAHAFTLDDEGRITGLSIAPWTAG
ncbi:MULTISPECIES: nuclear transport factor 2 family protein [Streptomyces]|uniref:Nuclear transport factor 2 family protein n=1 Tax=Streptomyces rochei TaxID=1928 RepID=A0ABW7ECJ3_STRRO|nr:nuclear transport factor 2 family protein [Streptomyces sp. MBT28]